MKPSELLQYANLNPAVEDRGDSKQETLPLSFSNVVPGFEIVSLVLLANVVTGRRPDIDAFARPTAKCYSFEKALTLLLQQSLQTDDDELANLLWDELYDRSPHLRAALTGATFNGKRLHCGWAGRAATIDGTDTEAVWKALTANCLYGAGLGWADGTTYYLNGVKFNRSSESCWLRMGSVYPAASRHWDNNRNPAEVEELRGYEKNVRVSWIVGAKDGVMRLFLFNRASVIEITNSAFMKASEDPQGYLDGVSLYAVHVQPELDSDNVEYAVVPSRGGSITTRSGAASVFVKRKIEELAQDSFNPSFVEYVCKCLEYPCLLVLDSSIGPDTLRAGVAATVNVLLSYSTASQDVNDRLLPQADEQILGLCQSAVRLYSSFTQWVYHFVYLIQAFKNGGDDADVKRFEDEARKLLVSVPYENPYVLYGTCAFLGAVYRSIGSGGAWDSARRAVVFCLRKLVSDASLSSFGVGDSSQCDKLDLDMLDSGKGDEEWNPIAAMEAVEGVKACGLVSKFIPKRREAHPTLQLREDYVQWRSHSELTCAIKL